MFRIFIIRS